MEKEIRTVLIVEDDSSVLRSLERLVRAGGFDARGFESSEALLRSDLPQTSTCLIVDVYLPDMNGVELCAALASNGRALPAILMTAKTGDPSTERLLRKAKAVAILYKPFEATALFDALSLAFSETAPHPA